MAFDSISNGIDSAMNSISAGAADAKGKLDETAEEAAINTAFAGMAPQWLIDRIQSDFRAIGIERPDSLSSSGMGQLVAQTATIGFILAAIISCLINLLFYGWRQYKLLTAFIVIIVLGLSFFYTKNIKMLDSLIRFVSTASVYIMILVVLWTVLYVSFFKGVVFLNPPGKKAPVTILEGLMYSFPFVDMYAYFDESVKSKMISVSKTIGLKSFAMLEMGWTALFLYIIGAILTYTRPKWESFIDKIKESFMTKEEVEEAEPFIDKTAVAEATDDVEQVTLVNIQPVSLKQAGYVGPAEKGGEFETDRSMIEATRAGVRFFVLQIDYLEKSLGDGFDPVKKPTLLYRNDSGTLISKNGASIADLAKQISTYVFNKDFPSHTDPLILYLHFIRTPDVLANPDKYLAYLNSVGEALAPIQPYILNKHDMTDFTRQKAERILLYSPLSKFNGKILLWTNADTSIFRNTGKLSMSSVPLTQDLDYMTCMRVYLDDESDSFGITSMVYESNAHAVIVPFKRMNAMKRQRGEVNKEIQDFAMKGKTRFVIAMPGQTEEVKQRDIQRIMKELGVNTVPINLFGKMSQEILPQIKSWEGNPLYKMKPVMLQSSKTAVEGYTLPPNK
jgi:hypothetical protein